MYDAREHASQPRHVEMPMLAALRLATVPLAPTLLGKVGEVFASRLAVLQQRLQQGDEQAVSSELGRLERLGLQLQQAARVLNADGSFRPERVDLAAAAAQCVGEWTPEAQRLGVTLSGPREPFVAELVAGVAEQLLDLAIEHALHLGQHVQVDCGAEGVLPRPMLMLHVFFDGRAAAPADQLDDLHWQLIVTLAHAAGGSAHRTVTPQGLVLAVALSDAAAAQTSSREPGGLPRLSSIAGRRIALLEPQDTTRLQAAHLLAEVGGTVDAALTPESVLAGLSSGAVAPDVLVTGLPVGSPRVAPLLDALRAKQPGLRVVELVDDEAAFEMSVPGSDHPARVGRSTLPRTLVTAVSQELDTVGW